MIQVCDRRRPDAPCYACVCPEEGDVEEVQCSVMGVLAPMVGAIGALQAMEALKLIAGIGDGASGKLLLLDAQSSEWRSVRIRNDPACAVCGRPA